MNDVKLQTILSLDIVVLTIGGAINLMKVIENVLDDVPFHDTPEVGKLIEFKDTLLHCALEYLTEEEIAYCLGEV